MIRRLFYFSLGAFTAVWAMRRLRALHPNHLARRAVNSATGVAAALRDFTLDVRHLTALRETELRAEYGLGSVEGNGVASNGVERDGAGRNGARDTRQLERSPVTAAATHRNHDVKDGR